MKPHYAPSWLLLGIALVLLPFTVLLKTYANDHLREVKKRSSTPSSAGAPASFTVTNNLDSGPGSLRDAIDQANTTPDKDSIDFVSGLSAINVGSLTGLPLPNITESLTIDGGATRVELNGTNAGSGANGLTIVASGVIVKSLVINRFQGDGISIQANNCIIRDNIIGTDIEGSKPSPNGRGVFVNGSNNLIGGPSSSDANIISGNLSFGIELNSASNNTIQGNFIGTDLFGSNALPNGQGGIRTLGTASNNMIGGTVRGAANTIRFNAGSGVTVFAGSSNSILGNSIFNNESLGINLSDDPGVTANNMRDLDTGANGLQKFPMLTSATSGGGITTIAGLLDSTINTSFRVEFFSSPSCDASGNGQGQTFIGAATISTPVSSSVAAINVNFAVAVAVGSVITATATDSDNNTSEFSQCATVTAGQVSDLQITTSDSPVPVLSGYNITYTIGIRNNGPDTNSGVTFTDAIPAGTTFVSLTSPGSCSSPPVGGTGVVSCSLGPLTAGAQAAITLVVNVNALPGSTITNTATVSGASGDSNLLNNSALAGTPVSPTGCSLSCPSDLVASTKSSDSSCGTVVTYPTVSGCGTTFCVPSSGSVFPVGSTTVTCSDSESSCSFNVLVFDAVAPSLFCSTGVAVPLPPGSSSAVVNYPAPTATDACGGVIVSCIPPSGSVFPPGATLVTCSARDGSENTTSCSFFVSVLDAQGPVIRCPGDISVSLPAGQTSAVVTYPPPTVTDNLPGVSATCSPASGSTFPQGITTVTCTAIDTGGNRASCSFTVGVGAPQVSIIIPGNKPTVDFTAAPARKVKPKNNPCSSFTIENTGSSPLVLTLDSIVRTGAAVDSGRITDPNDTRFFSLSLINADQSLTPLDIGGTLTIQPRQSRNICVKFAALIPALAGKTTGLAAANVLPDTVTSRIVFRQNAGANIFVPLSARVSTALVFVNISNPRAVPEVLFTRSGDDITVSYGIYDSNLDVTRSKYEFLNGSGQVVAGPFEIDLAGSVSSANLLKGQSFSVEQRFTGGSDNPDATGVRVTVFDGETSVVNPTSANTISAASIELMNRTRRVTLLPPSVSLRR